MCFQAGGDAARWVRLDRVRFDQIHGTRRAAPRACVHQDDEVVRIEQCVGEIESANSEVLQRDLWRQRVAREPACNFGPKAVIAEENISDARDEHPWIRHTGSISSALKKKRWPGWRRSPKSLPGSSSITIAICTWPS